MSESTNSISEAYTPSLLWKAPVRFLHWLVAISMAGATFLTAQGEMGHTMLGWVALSGLLIQLLGLRETYAPGLVLWLVTAGVIALNMSGLLAAQSIFHLGATLVMLVIAAFYCATVVFELLQRVGARILATGSVH
jgi:hypothetical protein